ncbi:MAG: YraN family protein [Chloroflexia bacterium]
MDYLRQKGYELLETNWRCPGGELDLILTHGEAVVFVEVRTRRGERAGSPEESVTRAKQDRLRSLAPYGSASSTRTVNRPSVG